MQAAKIVSALVVALGLCASDLVRYNGPAVPFRDAAGSRPIAGKTVRFWGPENYAMADAGPERAAELGMKFSLDTTAQLTGVRFYKFPSNSGEHAASLWSCDGTLLASMKFAHETSSGWQQTDFKDGIPLQSKELYVISYHQSNGHYAYTKGFFDAPLDAPPLHAPVAAGVFAYGESTFPRQSFQNTNYWVEPVVYTAPPSKSSHTVSLTWKASATPKVTYSIYRKSCSGDQYDPSPIASRLAVLNYDDHVTAARGEKFQYGVRAVNDANRESLNSNEVQVIIPGH